MAREFLERRGFFGDDGDDVGAAGTGAALARQRQQRLEQRLHLGGGTTHAPERIPVPLRPLRVALEEVQRSLEYRQGCAQFVPGVAREHALALDGGVEP